ncbi:MAG: hypothetical protein C0425_01305 [Chlorobiaceae bacterium]|nr:hypothetical protein [Chlorobiaceae bacterium]MBA4308959.1 hypothetical protein [Chlorobiaceae bacterium]
MKKIFFLIFIIIFATVSVEAQQNRKKQQKEGLRKIEELEKIRLIENLNLSEENAIRFFSRRNDHQDKIREMNNQIQDLLLEMKSEIDDGKTSNLKKLTDDYLKMNSAIQKERENFILSLSDILTQEQVAKFLIFQKKFRDEIQELLLKNRKKERRQFQE